MAHQIPSQCPECGAITIEVVSVPPSKHDLGTDWLTRAKCEQCSEYVKWFD